MLGANPPNKKEKEKQLIRCAKSSIHTCILGHPAEQMDSTSARESSFLYSSFLDKLKSPGLVDRRKEEEDERCKTPIDERADAETTPCSRGAICGI